MTIRLGCGAGFGGDRIDAATDLAVRGELDYLIFECVAERTLALGQLARKRDPETGYNIHLVKRLEAVLPACRENGTTIVTNMGVANPGKAGEVTVETARRLGLPGVRVAVVEGDDVSHLINQDTLLPELGKTVREIGLRMVAANAYLGGDVIAEALKSDPAVVITGRVADPSLVVGPLAHRFGWSFDNWEAMGRATLVGHLLECAALVTGGYFADPGYKDVENLAYIGYPMAEVEADGSAVITKLADTGGAVIPHTIKEQLFYEVHDPRAYLTPDVIANFADVRLAEVGLNRVAVSGATGRQRPDQLKVTVGFDGGFLAEGGMSYAGPGALERGQLAAAIVRERMENLHHCKDEIRLDLIGANALHATAEHREVDTQDVRLRAAIRTTDKVMAETLLAEVEGLYNCGPAAPGGFRGALTPSVVTHAAFIDRAAVETSIKVLEA